METEQASCRFCKMALKGKPYQYGQPAYHPKTNEQVKINYYGGFVCSESCDIRACQELESSMPGAGKSKHLSSGASAKIKSNWS